MSKQDQNTQVQGGLQVDPVAQAPSPITDEENAYADSLEFDTGVIEKIVGITAKDVQGILDMKGSFISGITQSFTAADDVTRGITAEVNEQDVIVDMKVILEFGSSAPAIFAEVKEKVRAGLFDMTGLTLQELNMRVVDVMTKKAYEEASKKNKDHVQAQQEPISYPTSGQPGYY